jgi:hypothetical protein
MAEARVVVDFDKFSHNPFVKKGNENGEDFGFNFFNIKVDVNDRVWCTQCDTVLGKVQSEELSSDEKAVQSIFRGLFYFCMYLISIPACFVMLSNTPVETWSFSWWIMIAFGMEMYRVTWFLLASCGRHFIQNKFPDDVYFRIITSKIAMGSFAWCLQSTAMVQAFPLFILFHFLF